VGAGHGHAGAAALPVEHGDGVGRAIRVLPHRHPRHRRVGVVHHLAERAAHAGHGEAGFGREDVDGSGDAGRRRRRGQAPGGGVEGVVIADDAVGVSQQLDDGAGLGDGGGGG
jgi:hypothetical protein